MSQNAEHEAGAEWAKRLFPNVRRAQPAAEPRKSCEQRIKEWGEKCRAEATAAEAARTFGAQVRTTGRFPSSYAIGERRAAMDGTQWQRVS
ncbi:hypothetical protein MKK65_29575 [Methylobacterium sp. J-001]|uniref:hypothetical protein n=1 Tax=Methylobacterium sp. J-001 TaxID=2836609 RepID=UPI001FBB6D73|nr:hypothetical protein [Methylobacterium sp. J-001]MCJ2120659.1 hypothetical protein [Methylobacterium sp. J-001]